MVSLVLETINRPRLQRHPGRQPVRGRPLDRLEAARESLLRRARPAPASGDMAVRRCIKKQPLGVMAGVLLLAMVALAFAGNWVAPYGYEEADILARLKPRAPRAGSAPTISGATCSRASSTPLGFLCRRFGAVGPGLANVILTLGLVLAVRDSRASETWVRPASLVTRSAEPFVRVDQILLARRLLAVDGDLIELQGLGQGHLLRVRARERRLDLCRHSLAELLRRLESDLR